MFVQKAANKVAAKFARNLPPKTVTWELKVRQMGLQKKELAEIMVDQLDLTCTPEQYLEETYKYHMELFGDVSVKIFTFVNLRITSCTHLSLNLGQTVERSG